MGDRVLFQVVSKDRKEYGPVVYGHWSGSDAVDVCRRLADRMRNRPGDVAYTSARLVQELTNGCEGSLSYGLWNADGVLEAADSHGDAGIVLITVGSDMTFECMGGYLNAADFCLQPA